MVIESIGKIVNDRPLFSISPDASIQQACEMLDRHSVSALVVLDGDRLAGVLSERDVISRVITQKKETTETLVSDIMTRNPQTVALEASLANAMKKMLRGGFRHLPVLDRDRVAGMLSMRDIPTEYRVMFERFQESRSAFCPHQPALV